MMKKQLIINSTFSQTRIALRENNRLAEIFYEFAAGAPEVGSIYKGIVNRVLPGLNAAFVDIGMEKAAFLFGNDVLDPHERSIAQLLHEGQEVVVQIAKTALGNKGPRVTMHITLPGRYLVYVPFVPHIGISRRITDEGEKLRLRELIAALIPAADAGVIVRTAAAGVSAELLAHDLSYLRTLSEALQRTLALGKAPSLAFRDLDLAQKTLRDRYSDEMSEIVVDNREVSERLQNFCAQMLPAAQAKISYYGEPTPIFEAFGIEAEINRALGRRVDLPSGGYLIIEHTEALTTFDVNTGRFVGKDSAEHTIITTNREAISKIAEQLRLRNIGGIIVVDFIDMEDLDSREQLYVALLEELKQDRARTQVLRFSEFGLVQITRKRSSDSLERILMAPCAHCEGSGVVKRDL